MTNAATRQSDNIRPPIVGEVYVYSASVISFGTAIPDAWRGRYVTFEADGTDCYLLFGTVAVGADSTVTSGSNQCVKLPSDQQRPFRIPAKNVAAVTHFAIQASSGTPKVRVYLSSFQAQ
jgi:hypothetical protein